jgi:hypothetical protein
VGWVAGAVIDRQPAHDKRRDPDAKPRRAGVALPVHHRLSRDRVDRSGKVTLRYRSRLLHLGIGRRYVGTRVLLLVADRDVRVINDDGELLVQFTIDPIKQYQT